MIMSQDWVHADEKDEYLIDYLFDLHGYIILKNWIKKFKKDKFLVYLAEAKTQLHRVKNKAKSQLHRIKGKATTA